MAAVGSLGTRFPFETAWINRASEVGFEDCELTDLPEEQREVIYAIANGQHKRELVERLNSLGMRGTFEHRLPLSPMLAYDMDLLSAERAMVDYLHSLRASGLLVTWAEFQEMDPTRYLEKDSQSFDRILGAQHIERVAAHYHCPAIKVPKKIAVIDDGASELKVDLASMGCPSIRVYAERVVPVKEKHEVERLVQLMRVIKKAGFANFSFTEPNIFMTEGGFHFIDTQFSSFSPQPTSLERLNSFARLASPADLPAALEQAKEIHAEEPFGSQERAAAQDHFRAHPHRALIGAIGSVTLSIAKIFDPKLI